MAHRTDFSIKTYSGQMALCDVCSEIIAPADERLRTYIGETAQSDVCRDCTNKITAVVQGRRLAAARAARIAKSGPLAVAAQSQQNDTPSVLVEAQV